MHYVINPLKDGYRNPQAGVIFGAGIQQQMGKLGNVHVEARYEVTNGVSKIFGVGLKQNIFSLMLGVELGK